MDDMTDNDMETPTSCEAPQATDLYVSNISQHNLYVYVIQPIGPTMNEFRYRIVGTADWQTDLAINNLYYRYLNDLEPSTDYEFQVRHQCATGEWSIFSESAYFTTASSFTTDDTNSGPYAYTTIHRLAKDIPIFSEPIIEVFPQPSF